MRIEWIKEDVIQEEESNRRWRRDNIVEEIQKAEKEKEEGRYSGNQKKER